MLLIKEGVDDFREVSTQELKELLGSTLGTTSVERPYSFLMKGKKGILNGREQILFARSKSVQPQFTVYDKSRGKTVTYAYCHRLDIKRNQNGTTEQVLMASTGKAFPQKLGLRFTSNNKKITIPKGELDRLAYLAIYPESDVSPFRNGLATYSLLQPARTARENIAKIKEEIRLQNYVLNEMDTDTIRAFCLSMGIDRVDYKEPDELRSYVLEYAKQNPDKFRSQLNNSTMNLRADVVEFVNKGILKKQAFNGEVFWSVSQGDRAGELVAKIPTGVSDELASLVKAIFDNPSLLDELKVSYHGGFKAKKAKDEEAKEVSQPIAISESVSKVEDWVERKLITYFAPNKSVLLSDPKTGRKRAGTVALFTASDSKSWIEEFAYELEQKPEMANEIESL